MMEDFERLMSIAKEGRFDETRKVVQELDISDTDKARYNMMLWQLENKRCCPPPKAAIPKTPVISMILGFVLICAAFFFSGNTQTAAVLTGLVLLLYPLEYRLICRAFCSEQVDAECIDLQSTFGRSNRNPRYRAIWKYEYDGVTYIHRDMTTYKCPELGEIRSIGISPGTPHNIFTGKAPASALLFSASGFFILAFLLLYLMPPA